MSPSQTYQGRPKTVWARHSVLARNPIYADAPKAWLMGPLETFSLCMASHGLCVSSVTMVHDKAYATAQIACAQTLKDPALEVLALELAKQLELQQ